MKISLKLVACFLIATFITSCHKNDDSVLEKEQITETENKAPSIATLTTPQNNSELQLLTSLLKWTEAVDPEGDSLTYKVLLGTSEATLLPIATDLNNTEFQLGIALEKGTTYFWRVVAKDTSGNETTSDIFSFKTEYVSVNLLLTEADFSKRILATTTVFNNKIWVIGGQDESGNVLEDIWSSSDGINWTLETENAPFGLRNGHYTIVFKNKMWIYNGSNGSTLKTDIWSTSDGTNWVEETNERVWNNLPFNGQAYSTMFIYNNMVWRLAAYNGSTGDLTTERYIWNSLDGKNWNLVSENHGFDAKYGMVVISFQGKLIGLEGSNTSSNKFTNVWESNDGINWTLRDDNLPFLFGSFTDAIVYENRIYITAGFNYDELWFTDDGTNWTKAIEDRQYSEKIAISTVKLNGKIIIIGSGLNQNIHSNDVWVIE